VAHAPRQHALLPVASLLLPLLQSQLGALANWNRASRCAGGVLSDGLPPPGYARGPLNSLDSLDDADPAIYQVSERVHWVEGA
jgi:hypothetical protein